MSQIIHARFEDGVFKPEDPLDLPPNARVRLVVVPMSDLEPESVASSARSSNSGAMSTSIPAALHPSRDELHDRH